MDASSTRNTDTYRLRDAMLIPSTLVAGVALFFGGTAVVEARATPPVVLSATTLDLGRVAPEGHATGSVRLTNRSDRPVRIAGVTTSCGCTAAHAPKTVPAHGSAVLRIAVDASGKRHGFHEGVSVTFAGYESRPLEIDVVGSVGPNSAPAAASKAAECRLLP